MIEYGSISFLFPKIHENYYFFVTDDQEKAQCQKQKLAEQRREEARVQRQIEVAHKEMERLEKYVNTSVE